MAILGAGLTCSASLPHISGTKSSILDTVFVCRLTGRIPAKWIVDSPAGVAGLVRTDLENLKTPNFTATLGDIRCIIFGHPTRLAVWSLRRDWNKHLPTDRRLDPVAHWISIFGDLATVARCLDDILSVSPPVQNMAAQETQAPYYGKIDDQVSF